MEGYRKPKGRAVLGIFFGKVFYIPSKLTSINIVCPPKQVFNKNTFK